MNMHLLQAVGGAAQVDQDPPPDLEVARRWLWDTLDDTIGVLPDVSMPTPAASVTLALVVLADWVASTDDLIGQHQAALAADGFDPILHHQRALEFAETHTRAAGLVAPKRLSRPNPADLFDDHKTEWRGIQASIDSSFHPTEPGIAVICAPTGEGKTEAALIAASKFAAASGRHGMFFAMPTVATAEGLHDRLQRCIENLVSHGESSALRRVHSQALLADIGPDAAVSDDSAVMRAAASWMRGTRKPLLAPWGVGTVDQVLLGALRSKHSPIRVLGASTGVLVVDEVHALDPYMRKLLCRAVEWMAALGAPVVVLSATLPPKRIHELCSAYQEGCGVVSNEPALLGGYPAWVAWTRADGWTDGVSAASRSWELRIEVEAEDRSHTTQRISELALQAANLGDGQCVLVVRSTVTAAQETYQMIRSMDSSLTPGDSVEIIHSRLPRGIRQSRSISMLRRLGRDTSERPDRMIVVATQVVEQSFDVDFDDLITDPAPLSALLQRAGRIWRHRELADGKQVPTTVVWPLDEHGEPSYWSPIYSRADLMASYACVTSAGTRSDLMIRVPDDVPALVERTDVEAGEKFEFANEVVEDVAEATLAQLVRIDTDKSLAANWAIPRPRPDAPLHELTGHFDSDETHPGTRHQARSALVVPCTASSGGWQLADGTVIDPETRDRLSSNLIRKVFEASIPVSYPNPQWAEELPHLSDAWDRTPVAQAKILDVSEGQSDVGAWSLRVDSEVGLVISKGAA